MINAITNLPPAYGLPIEQVIEPVTADEECDISLSAAFTEKGKLS